jgi:hypothetical protein
MKRPKATSCGKAAGGVAATCAVTGAGIAAIAIKAPSASQNPVRAFIDIPSES